MGTHSSSIGSLGDVLFFELFYRDAAFDLSDTNILCKWIGRDMATRSYLFGGTGTTRDLALARDVTLRGKALSGGGADGTIALPAYSGRTLPGVATGAVTITNGKVTVTTPAAGGHCLTQRLYMTKASVTTPFYLAAEWADGAAAAGLTVGLGTYPGKADADLYELAPAYDESATSGYASLGTPATPTVVDLAGGGAGALTAGAHLFALVAVGPSDVASARKIETKLVTIDRRTGLPIYWPNGNSWEIWEIGD